MIRSNKDPVGQGFAILTRQGWFSEDYVENFAEPGGILQYRG